MQTLQLSDYQIFVGDFWASFRSFLSEKKYGKIFILVDTNTHEACYERFVDHFPKENLAIIQIEAGEQHKNLATCQAIWQNLFDGGADRKALLINLGGGVIGDMGGFCASTFKRGFDFVQMPTTLLSQVDASIGGKLGIDFYQVKNSIGVFANPKAVFISSDFLSTLPPREVRSGFAEIIKHALIRDVEKWRELLTINDLAQVEWAQFLVPSLKIKQAIVEADPFEKGLRKALNFGHTIGHAVESMALETAAPLTHGEAIAIGMVCEAYLSHITEQPSGKLSAEALKEICTFIVKIYGKYDITVFEKASLLALMAQDKKNDSLDINFSLLPRIGDVTINCTATPAEIAESLDFYTQL